MGNYLKTELTTTTYDSWGNAFYTIENITDKVNTNFSKVTSLVFNYTVANLNNWYLAQTISKTETLTTQSLKDPSKIDSKTISQTFVYDFWQRILKRKTYLPSSQYIGYVQTFDYDRFGNVVNTSTQDSTTMEVRSKCVVYDSNGINVIMAQNEMGQRTLYTYDLRDFVLTQTDPNNVAVTNFYNMQGLFSLINFFWRVFLKYFHGNFRLCLKDRISRQNT